jgi:hypothetical protein
MVTHLGSRSTGRGRLALAAWLLAAASGCATHMRFVCPAHGGPQWREVSTAHVVLRADLETAPAEGMARDLEAVYAHLAQALSLDPGAGAAAAAGGREPHPRMTRAWSWRTRWPTCSPTTSSRGSRAGSPRGWPSTSPPPSPAPPRDGRGRRHTDRWARRPRPPSGSRARRRPDGRGGDVRGSGARAASRPEASFDDAATGPPGSRARLTTVPGAEPPGRGGGGPGRPAASRPPTLAPPLTLSEEDLCRKAPEALRG